MARAITITLDGKRIAINTKVPRGQIEWLMGRVHVGMTDEAIASDFKNRVIGNPNYTPSLLRQTIAYALYCHRKNQKLYRHVSRGL